MSSPFAAIPPKAASVLRPTLPSLADEIIATIAAEVPDYERAMEGNFGRIVRLGVEVALGRFADQIDGSGSDDPARRETYVNLGRGEFHAGRSLDALLAAYRVGARVAWRRFVEAGVAGGLEPDAIYRLGEAIFEYIDELSAESAEGHAAEQMAEHGERRRRRRRLVRMLAADPPASEDDVALAAAAAGWELPRQVAALVTAAGEDDSEEAQEAVAERLARTVGQGAVAAALDGVACALVPDPEGPGRRRQLEAAVAGQAAALGPTVPLGGTAASVRRAVALQRLVAAGRVEASGLAVAGDHLVELLLAGDPSLTAELAGARLAPLAAVAPATAGRLRETLRAWLDRPGQVQAVAAVLGVHPQTVRYRVRQLRELFGPALEDPEARFELALALRASAGPAG